MELIAAFQAWQDRPSDPPRAEDGEEPTEPAPTRTGAKPVIDWDRVMPRVSVTVHTYAPACSCDEQATGIVRVPDHGPVTTAWVQRWLGDARFTIRPVLDLEGQAPVDCYEIPDRHRRAVEVMSPADVFPFATSTRAGSHQIDHTDPFEHAGTGDGRPPPGQSRIGNYGPLTPFTHRIKTHGWWQVQQPFPGIYVWRDPHGAFYLVDHTGTRRTGSRAPESRWRMDLFRSTPEQERLLRLVAG